jgi:hypothetical protein
MLKIWKDAIERLACGVYRVLLSGYPAEFRSRYGIEMKQVFRDQLRATLSKCGMLGFLAFCAGTAWDLCAGVLRERFTLQSFVSIICLTVALGFSVYAAYVDRHNATEVYPTLMVVLVGSFILGLVRPWHVRRWAIIVGMGVPFFGPLIDLPARLASPGRWAMLAVLFVPGLIGAHGGLLVRRGAGVLHRAEHG